MICQYCMKEIADDSVFCPNCGKKLELPERPQAPAAPAHRWGKKDYDDRPLFERLKDIGKDDPEAHKVQPSGAGTEDTIQKAKELTEQALPQIQKEIAAHTGNAMTGQSINARPSSEYSYREQSPSFARPDPLDEIKDKTPKEKTFFGGGALALCLVIIALLSGSTAWFAVMYFRAVGML